MSTLTLAEASRIVREAVKDRSYRATPLGLEVARYYRWKKNEWGATKDTLRDYEAILAKLKYRGGRGFVPGQRCSECRRREAPHTPQPRGLHYQWGCP